MTLKDLEIKPRDRTKVAAKPSKALCVVCCEPYTKKKPQQKACSKLCKLHLDMARNRVNRLRAVGVDEVELLTKNCVICGDEFDQIQPNYICCEKVACKKKRIAQKYKSWSKVNR